MPNKKNKYPNYIMEDLRRRCGLGPSNTSRDDCFNSWSKSRVLDEVAAWNGLLGGWGSEIKGWIRAIYGIDLDELEEKDRSV